MGESLSEDHACEFDVGPAEVVGSEVRVPSVAHLIRAALGSKLGQEKDTMKEPGASILSAPCPPRIRSA